MASAANQAGGATSSGAVSEEKRRLADVERAQQARRKQSLDLQRELILSQRTSNAGRRAALEAALKDIEAQLATLN
ncbi:MAG TPA: hypothetical protein VHW46_11630 [Terracidiphilus sp.]|nr:hypothetical protein [Terracidiphilus sp.]